MKIMTFSYLLNDFLGAGNSLKSALGMVFVVVTTMKNCNVQHNEHTFFGQKSHFCLAF